MELSNVGCRLLLNQLGMRKISMSEYICRYTSDNTVCVGMPEDYFEFMCDTLCLIYRKSNETNVFDYERCICKKFGGSHPNRRLLYEFDAKYTSLTTYPNSDDLIANPMSNPELSMFLDFCKYLDQFDFEISKRKFLLTIYAFLLYGCKTDAEIDSDEWQKWEQIINGIRKEIVDLNYFINLEDWRNRICIIFEKYVSDVPCNKKKMLNDFYGSFKRTMKRFDKEYITKRMKKTNWSYQKP